MVSNTVQRNFAVFYRSMLEGSFEFYDKQAIAEYIVDMNKQEWWAFGSSKFWQKQNVMMSRKIRGL